MAQLLHIDSSPQGGASVFRRLSAAAAQALAGPGVRTVYRDLAAHPIPHLGGELIAALRPAPGSTPPDTPAVRAELALTEEVLGEFLASDVVVVGAPFYNFGIPSQLKAWIDRLAQAGRTFRYTAEGPQGLAGGKRVVIVSSRGGKYAGTPYEAALDHQEAYLKAVFGFFGITDVAIVRAEGITLGPDARAAAIEAALADVRRLAA
ncbi:FMN-dependent NADH-azoreductase [Xylophilus sp.]|uniref:FMN-dependent NADH-azoreductase n=1 Tax=Xylophilus sp. TaxID=2653893 RepID=UPI0013BA207C|nr:FMN-dependent NADH-azoreductase [Xylophilus sp.]KAF1047422.1 MAG: FMN-dependent NADH-azoreductase 1 [Xylophilus sp.]